MGLLVFDLDGTLYDRRCGLSDVLTRRVRDIFEEFSPDRSDQAFREMTAEYGTVLVGLHRKLGVPWDDLTERMRRVDYESYLHPTPGLAELIASCPRPRVVFSNAPRTHVEIVLRLIGMTGLFDRAVTAEDVLPAAKPSRASFVRLSELTGHALPDMLLFDDKIKTALAARSYGVDTVLITSGRAMEAPADMRQYVTITDALKDLAP